MKTCLGETGLAIVDEIGKAAAILATYSGLLAILLAGATRSTMRTCSKG